MVWLPLAEMPHPIAESSRNSGTSDPPSSAPGSCLLATEVSHYGSQLEVISALVGRLMVETRSGMLLLPSPLAMSGLGFSIASEKRR